MRVSEALEAVGVIYSPGVAAYYAKHNPDPWLTAHENLERATLIHNDDVTEAACAAFVSKCSDLISNFKRLGAQPKDISNADAFAMGSVERVDAHFSRKLKRCIKCEGKMNLKIRTTPGSDQTFVICTECEKRAA